MRKGNHAGIIVLYDSKYLQRSIAKVKKLQCQKTQHWLVFVRRFRQC